MIIKVRVTANELGEMVMGEFQLANHIKKTLYDNIKDLPTFNVVIDTVRDEVF